MRQRNRRTLRNRRSYRRRGGMFTPFKTRMRNAYTSFGESLKNKIHPAWSDIKARSGRFRDYTRSFFNRNNSQDAPHHHNDPTNVQASNVLSSMFEEDEPHVSRRHRTPRRVHRQFI